MNFSLTYLIGRFLYRILDFFHHWYTDGSRIFFYKLISFLQYLDNECEKNIPNPDIAVNNPAGKLIELVNKSSLVITDAEAGS